MYDWHEQTLSTRERMLLSDANIPGRFDPDTVLEYQIALVKDDINQLVPKIKNAFSRLPAEPHRIYWKTRTKFQMSMDAFGVRPDPRPDQIVLFMEDYPAWDEYFNLTEAYRMDLMCLADRSKKLVRLRERPVAKNKNKYGGSVQPGLAERNGR